ncbi:hypothetical protein A3H10_05140 [Candidatus Uhrbacteria bacterium RIFCSPLOWO2_12_FULL_46_10]|uniref:Endolytic murein transglycosylase n=1 Tax=Candidatus Uhrbacteria bacterium RIFCSPLOWO2_01_FULL_47_25 TaxID=1802402 RepID=A0A1F7UUP9_9BACT|nr:MAG: hypothetical protein A3D60_05410 [Candidatus Uhrbacteria bacterium RIFCSPHIGHO2_02_FULL_47_29]OGL75220.1 MAG: hypothetical protein A3E96_03120 [Candidatus Uhrbacteria bacterium RIFCSPHIGHO2_12_FULL_46_13]OGL81464.1 MAG: hypothetical protein A2936_00070 [Candidatus Uhrbacteria bacterium RIFCSPLOWO2_01_FULL_47_25]OGL85133.1 MAG: hypothetical protein A3I37_04870 [Candidatus Uhrbacteria bacterium RIFCSPLOWO2_02_FULL_46_19]OGL90153.1 MAG: hypothetical protein A3H10_05140 [Candidatus Uhrbacte
MPSKIFSLFFLGVVAFMLAILLYLGYFVSAIVRPAGASNEIVSFMIDRGEGVDEISAKLFDRGLINSRWNFAVYVLLRRWNNHLQAGEYQIPKNANIREVAEMLAVGRQASLERVITIIEGWTIDDIAGYLEREGIVQAADFREAAARLADKSPISALSDKPSGASLEGFLFPDTYRVFKGSTSEEIINKMLTNFETKLTLELRSIIANKEATIFQTITMASILEKEIRLSDDLSVAADVFYKRLRVSKPLESDATLNYVLPAALRKSRLSTADLKNSSPYNTYRYQGLPPGPIGNPGMKAIEAAILPQPNNYWFFLTTPDGETIFSKTAEEHIRNKQKYLK